MNPRDNHTSIASHQLVLFSSFNIPSINTLDVPIVENGCAPFSLRMSLHLPCKVSPQNQWVKWLPGTILMVGTATPSCTTNSTAGGFSNMDQPWTILDQCDGFLIFVLGDIIPCYQHVSTIIPHSETIWNHWSSLQEPMKYGQPRDTPKVTHQ